MGKDVEVALKKAAGKANSAYSATFVKMAEQRKALMDETGSAVANLNDAIAKYAALQNTHFSKTVKNIKAARKAADTSVMDARKVFGASHRPYGEGEGGRLPCAVPDRRRVLWCR